MSPKIKCFFGFHNKKDLPWFYVNPRTTDPFKRLMPNKACLECGKLYYKNRPYIIITTIEGGRTPWIKYEGEWIAKGFSSREEMLENYRKTKRDMITSAWAKRKS